MTPQTEIEPVHELWTEHEAKPRRKWHRETFACAFSGHLVPAAKVARLRPEDAGLGFDLPDGRRFARCLRCDAWVQTTPPSHPTRDTLPSLDELEVPKRGKALRDQLVLRLIAIDRGIHSVLFALIAVAVFLVEFHFVGLRREAQSLLDALNAAVGQTGQGNSHSIIATELSKFLNLRADTLLVIGATATAYAVVEGVEAVGLWLERRWAEYLTAIATAGFLPFEIHELTVRVTVLRVTALVVNVAILVYLVWRKRLFGIRGGVKALERGRELDREELFGPPPPARQA